MRWIFSCAQERVGAAYGIRDDPKVCRATQRRLRKNHPPATTVARTNIALSGRRNLDFETLLDRESSKARRRRVSRAMDAAGDTANSSFAERPRPNSH